MYKNILFIEDEVFIAEMYADILRAEGYNVTLIGDGQKGLEAAQTGKYDLILLDLMLPNVTGLEILRILRDPAVSPNFTRDKHQVIILSNLDENDIVRKEITDLANAYYMKVNITPHKLAEILKEKGGAPNPAAATHPA